MGCKMDFLTCNGSCENGNKPCEMTRCELWDNDSSECHDRNNDDYDEYINEHY